MYEDREYVRVHAMKLSLNKFEKGLVAAVAAYKGMEASVLARDVLVRELMLEFDALNSEHSRSEMERTERNPESLARPLPLLVDHRDIDAR